MIDQRAVNPLWEDPVTMAVNAANSILNDEDRRQIELLVVASESALDFEKPLSTWVQRYLGLTANCRNFEIKHACYGATAAVQMASYWLASAYSSGRKALVIATDQSRTHLGKPWEYMLGAGSAAVLLSRKPRILELELGKNGYWTDEISDVFRPTATLEVGNSETSLVSYLDALEGAFDHFLQTVPDAAEYDRYFQRHVYHMPFGGMAWRAHKMLLRRSQSMSTKEAWANFERKGLAALKHIRRMGATYSSSTFIGLLGLTEDAPDLNPGELVSMFSYGSGSCAEFYCGRIGEDAKTAAAEADVSTKLNARRMLTVAEYEALETQRTAWADCGTYEVCVGSLDGWYDRTYAGHHRLTFRGLKDYYREYEWS
jgi:hydroxymethylglutaryl-CoA synthase